jgi:hypothetical protein
MTDDALKLAKEQFEESCEGGDFNRAAAEEDIRFAQLGEQWPKDVAATRMAEGRPCLTINRLPAFIRQVTNEIRQNRAGVKVGPVDNGADKDTAQVIQGSIRQIERRSNADVAYDTAGFHAVANGFGFFRIGIDFVHDQSFEMEARIERIANPLTVHWDTNSTAFDASDWEYGFVSDWMTSDKFKAEYPDADAISFEGADTSTDVGGDSVRVAEWFAKESDEFQLVEFIDMQGRPRVVKESDLAEIARSFLRAGEMDDSIGSDDEAIRAVMAMGLVEEKRRRKVKGSKIVRRIISGADVLEETIWPGRNIPICPVWGDEVIVDGKRHFRSMIRDAKDPQKMMNFWRSATTELVALAPKAPWLIAQQALPTDSDEVAKWATANSVSHEYLTFNADGGAMSNRIPFAGVPAGALQEAQLAQDDIKAIIGIYDSSLGARSNETSGRAILARQREADVSNFHFIDNLNRAIRYGGDCLVDIIPAVYSGREMIRILGEDGRERLVKIASAQDALMQPGPEAGGERVYNLNTGVYDVAVDAGPSYATQREEAREVMLELGRAVPAFWMVSADIFMRNMDFQGSDELVDRLAPLVQAQMAQIAGSPQQPQQPGAQMPQPMTADPRMNPQALSAAESAGRA